MEWSIRDPFHSVNYAKDDNGSRRYYFSDMDIKEIMIDADIYHDFFTFLLHTGIRSTAAYTLKPDHIQGRYIIKQMNKTGDWLNTVKEVFGFVMFGLAIWILNPLVPFETINILWSILIIFAGIYFGGTKIYKSFKNNKKRRERYSGFVVILIGFSMLTNQFIGMKKESTNQKLSINQDSLFKQILSVEDLDKNLKIAGKDNEITLLYVTADWCVSCRQLEKETFTDKALTSLFAEINTLKADVSMNSEEDKALMNKYGIFGPPTMLIFSTNGEEQNSLRKIGVTKAKELFIDLSRLKDKQAKILGANL